MILIMNMKYITNLFGEKLNKIPYNYDS